MTASAGTAIVSEGDIEIIGTKVKASGVVCGISSDSLSILHSEIKATANSNEGVGICLGTTEPGGHVADFIYTGGDLTIEDSKVNVNVTGDYSKGILVYNGDIDVTDSIIDIDATGSVGILAILGDITSNDSDIDVNVEHESGYGIHAQKGGDISITGGDIIVSAGAMGICNGFYDASGSQAYGGKTTLAPDTLNVNVSGDYASAICSAKDDIEITAGIVKAISSGDGGEGIYSYLGNIVISGGTINAEGSKAIFAEQGKLMLSNLSVTEPSGAKISDDEKTIVDSDDNVATSIKIGKASSSRSGNKNKQTPTDDTTITVPINNDSANVEIQATVSGNEVTVQIPDSTKIDSIAQAGSVEIDLSSLSGQIESVKLPTETLQQIAEANAEREQGAEVLSIKLHTGSISFDAVALNALLEQTDGTELRLVLDDAGTKNLNAAQKESIKEMNIYAVVDAYLVNVKTNERISDFKGGIATLSVPFEIPVGTIAAGYTVWYVDDNGKMTKHPTWHKDDRLYWTTGHLSDYVIAYDADAAVNQFVDVSANSYFYDAVLWAAKQGITSGTDSTHFSPALTCTRAQMVTFLWRAAGSPEPNNTVSDFVDLASNAYYYKAVLWAAENGYTMGTSDTTFSPDAKVTRAQTVAFLWRIAGQNAQSSANPFADILADKYYYDAVLWAAEQGITDGTSDTTFSPNNDCTRGQIVTFLYRYFAN